MNNIGLIISGNLTGFQNFYASPNANEIYKEAKFDFDYRNFLTFLNNDDKAYAISFAPTVISVSLVTRILDSFRRPGVLVVSILLPRNKKVESAMNAQNNKALYQLLNAVHDTFREKNFVNGMVNQNAAVLMQDYYTDILSNFVLVPDGLQRPINARIDVSSPNKRIGYVKSTEDNVPLYLSSLCRKSYEGYHHVFIAENAPQNIDEEPVEVVFYSVKVVNTGLTLQNVKLTDKIYNLRPEEGEIDIDKNFTYQQILNGEAGRSICASIVDETIEISYRFGKETKEIKFSFRDATGSLIPFVSVSPRIVFSNGEKVNISNEVWSFEGKEIYERKTIESGNSNFTIKRESTNLDIRRLKNGSECLIHVEQSSPININFPAPYNKLKQITFRRKNGESKVFNVESYLNDVLPGRLEEYAYVIESNYYDRVTGQLPPLGVPFTIDLRAKTDNHSSPAARTTSTNHRADSNLQRTSTTDRGTNGGSLKLDGENTVKPIKKKNNKTVLWGSVASSSVLLVLLLVFFWPNITKIIGGAETPDLVASNDSVDRRIVLNFIGVDNDPIEDLSDCGFTYETFSKYVNIYVSPENFVEKIDSVTTGKYQLTYNVSGSASEIKEVSFTISVRNTPITANDSKTVIYADELEDTLGFNGIIDIKLNVKASEISLYNELENITTITWPKINQFQKRVDAIGNKDFAAPLQRILDNLKSKIVVEEQKKETKVTKDGKDSSKDTKVSDELPSNIKDRIQIPTTIGKSLKNDLSDVQKVFADKYNTWVDSIYTRKTPNQQKEILRELKNCSTFKDLQKVIKKYQRAN